MEERLLATAALDRSKLLKLVMDNTMAISPTLYVAAQYRTQNLERGAAETITSYFSSPSQFSSTICRDCNYISFRHSLLTYVMSIPASSHDRLSNAIMLWDALSSFQDARNMCNKNYEDVRLLWTEEIRCWGAFLDAIGVPSSFYLSKSVPKNLRDVTTSASGELEGVVEVDRASTR